MVRRAFRMVLGAAALAVAAGCQFDPNYASYTRSRPSPRDVAGEWSLDLERTTWKTATSDPSRVPTLILRPAGTVEAKDVPDAWPPDDRLAKGSHRSVVGTWTLGTWQDFQVVQVHFAEMTGWGPPHIRPFNLTGEGPPYGMLAVIGDPDSGEVVAFRRRSPAEANPRPGKVSPVDPATKSPR